MLTNTELSILKSDVTSSLATYMAKYVSEKKKGLVCNCLLSKASYLDAVSTILSYWEQNADGSTTNKTNYITDEQFNNLVKTTNNIIKI